MIAERLKKSVLQAAMEGKLTKRSLGKGEDVLKQINLDRNRLIKEGKLKKTKLKKINYELDGNSFPNNWKLVTLNDISFVTKLAGFEYTKYISGNIVDKGIPLFKGKNVQNGNLILEFEDYITEETSNTLFRSQLNRKCLLTPYVGTIGNIAIFENNFQAHLGSNVGKIELFNHYNINVLEEYVLYYLRSPIGLSQLKKNKKATAQESISIQDIRDVQIFIPPLEEQKDIVNKIEQLLTVIDELEKNEKELKLLENKFPERLRNSILLSAIQGFMNDNENLTFNNNSPVISDISIPKHWKLVRLDKLVLLLGGYAFKSSQYLKNYSVDAIRVIRISDFNNFGLVNKSIVYYKYDEALSRYEIKENDILLCMTGGTVGKNLLIKDVKEKMYLNQRVAVLRNKNDDIINIEYLYFVIQSPYIQSIINESKNSTNDNISMKQISNFMIPLPPINEQKEIVERLKNIFKYI